MQALILVDIQNDFLPTGALPVPAGDEVVHVANRLMPEYDLVVATQDWHPANHGSFAANHTNKEPGEVIELAGLSQILWPIHCVQDSPGADFAEQLHTNNIDKIFTKGTDATIDSYSGFFDNGHRKATGLGDYLKEKDVSHVTVIGLATDYCVKFTALDAVQLGFDVTLIEEGCRGVNLQPNDVADALNEMEAAGVNVRSKRT